MSLPKHSPKTAPGKKIIPTPAQAQHIPSLIPHHLCHTQVPQYSVQLHYVLPAILPFFTINAQISFPYQPTSAKRPQTGHTMSLELINLNRRLSSCRMLSLPAVIFPMQVATSSLLGPRQEMFLLLLSIRFPK